MPPELNPQTPPAGATPPAATPPAEVTPPAATPPAAPNKIQERINQLYGQKKEAEETVQAIQKENEILRTQMLSLQEKIGALESPPPAPAPFTPAVVPPKDGKPDVDISKIVKETMSQVFNERESNIKEAKKLRQQHVESWAAAIKDEPLLKDESSDLYKTAQNVWDSDPAIRNHPNGPFKAAIMAKGLIGTPVDNNKLNASVQLDGVSVANGSNPKTELEAATKVFNQAREELQNGGLTAKWYPLYQKARMDIARLTKNE